MADLTFKNELLRKSVHLSSLGYPILYFFIDQEVFVEILSIIFIGLLIWDILRRKGFKFRLFSLFNHILREEEINNKRFTGATFFVLAMLIVAVFFPKIVAIFAIIVLVIGDTSAALFGRKFPIKKIGFLDKSIGGMLAFIVSSIFFIHIYYFLAYDIYYISSYAYLAILVASIVEMVARKINIDDNLLVALVCAIVFNLGY